MNRISHLLRHLNDPCEVHSNPLIAELAPHVGDEVALTAIVRAIVERELCAIGKGKTPNNRRARILVRCDLQGESRKRVAAEMGLSLRQLYRDRRHALGMLEVVLRRELMPCHFDYAVASRHRKMTVTRLLRDAIRAESRDLRLLLLTRALQLTVEDG